MKKIKKRYGCLIFILVLNQGLSAQNLNGDRHPEYELEYPKEALIQNGGSVYNIKNPPKNNLTAALGNGIKDDTQAFIDAFDYILKLKDNGRDPSLEEIIKEPNGNYEIYIPNGTYIVSKPITYTGPTRIFEKYIGKNRNENVVGMKWVGQHRDSTIIKLANSSNGFNDKLNPKALFPMARPEVVFNNWASNSHGFRHLTIDVTNNVGAVGIDYWAANSGLIMDVSVKANPGAGHIGIHFRIAVAAGYFQDITIRNFKYGIKSSGDEIASNPVFEHISLINQDSVAFSVAKASCTVRDLYTNTNATAVEIAENEGQVILIDSKLYNGNTALPAINVKGTGHLYVRNLKTLNYKNAVQINNKSILATGNHDEYTNYKWRTSRSNTSALNLPIKDVPIFQFPKPINWAKPNGFDNAAVQQALNANKKAIYFPSILPYDFGDVNVPANVNFLYGFKSDCNGTFNITEYSPTPLVIFFIGRANINNTTNRTVIIHGAGGVIKNNGTDQDWHLCSVGQIVTDKLTNAHVYGRWINAEGVHELKINNCTWVQMGYKTERLTTPGIIIYNNSNVELLGGTFGVSIPDALCTIEKGSNATIIINNGAGFKSTLPVIKDEGYSNLYKERFPLRNGNDEWFYMFTANSTIDNLKINDSIYTNEALIVFPNPTETSIKVSGIKDIFSYKIYDMNGKIVAERTNQNANSNIDVSTIGAGIYNIKFFTKDRVYTKKVIIQKK